MRLAFSNIRQRPLRSLISALGVALGVILVMLFTGLTRGMSNDAQRRATATPAQLIFARSGSSVDLMSSTANTSLKYVDELKKIDGVEDAVPLIKYVSQGASGFGFEQIEGVPWTEYAALNGLTFTTGRAPQALDEAVVDVVKAQNNNLQVGSTLKIFGDKPYRVVGIYAPESGARVKLSLAAMQDALEAKGKATYILVRTRVEQEEQTATRINAALPGNKLEYTRDLFVSVEKSIPFLNTFLRVLVILAAIVSALVVMLAMYTTITERTREIGILKAMGASRGYIIGAIEQEAILISLLGLIIGFAAALLIGWFIQRKYGLLFEYNSTWVIVSAVIGLLGGALGALYPATRAANLDPVNALAYE